MSRSEHIILYSRFPSVLFSCFGVVSKIVFYRYESQQELEKLLLLPEPVRGYHFYRIHPAQNDLLHRQPDLAKRNAGCYGHAWVHTALRLWGKNDLRYILTHNHSIYLLFYFNK